MYTTAAHGTSATSAIQVASRSAHVCTSPHDSSQFTHAMQCTSHAALQLAECIDLYDVTLTSALEHRIAHGWCSCVLPAASELSLKTATGSPGVIVNAQRPSSLLIQHKELSPAYSPSIRGQMSPGVRHPKQRSAATALSDPAAASHTHTRFRNKYSE
jgi:hypothetical protein